MSALLHPRLRAKAVARLRDLADRIEKDPNTEISGIAENVNDQALTTSVSLCVSANFRDEVV